jgi:hypothetical protein
VREDGGRVGSREGGEGVARDTQWRRQLGAEGRPELRHAPSCDPTREHEEQGGEGGEGELRESRTESPLPSSVRSSRSEQLGRVNLRLRLTHRHPVLLQARGSRSRVGWSPPALDSRPRLALLQDRRTRAEQRCRQPLAQSA